MPYQKIVFYVFIQTNIHALGRVTPKIGRDGGPLRPFHTRRPVQVHMWRRVAAW